MSFAACHADGALVARRRAGSAAIAFFFVYGYYFALHIALPPKLLTVRAPKY
jgi:hypothetical protein